MNWFSGATPVQIPHLHEDTHSRKGYSLDRMMKLAGKEGNSNILFYYEKHESWFLVGDPNTTSTWIYSARKAYREEHGLTPPVN